MSQEMTSLPEDLEPLRRRFAEFRSTQPARARLPEPLWAAATELAAHYGVHPIARALHLDYTGLKKRVAQRDQPKPKRATSASPVFLELMGPAASAVTACTVAVEAVQGGKLRLDLKAVATTELAPLIRAFLGH
jgi:hypothetical protein